MRNQKAKGLKVKQSIEIFLLIAILAWLLYQVKHSYYEKTALQEMNLKGTNKVLELHREALRIGRKGLLHGRETSSANDDRDGDEEIVVTDEEQELKGPQDDPIDADGRGSEDGDTESMYEKHNGVVIPVHGAVDASTGEAYNSRTVNEDINNVHGANVTEKETMLMDYLPDELSDKMQQRRNSTTVARMDILSSLTTETGSKYLADKQISSLATISLENEASNKSSSQYQDAIEEMGNDDDEEDMVEEETAKTNVTARVEIEERKTTLSVINDTTTATSAESDLSTLADGVSQNSSKSLEEEAVDL